MYFEGQTIAGETGVLARVPWRMRDVLHGLGLVLGSTVVVIALLGIFFRGDDEVGASPEVSIALAFLPAVMLVAVWLFAVRRYRVPWRTLGFSRPQGRWTLALPWVALIGSLGFAGLYVVAISIAGLDYLLPPEVPGEALGDGVHRLANLFVVAVLTPVSEEAFFRGFVLAALVRPLGPAWAAVAASAIFAVGHVIPTVMVPVFVSGLLLSWLYLRTRSIWPSVVAHSAQNLIVFTAAA